MNKVIERKGRKMVSMRSGRGKMGVESVKKMVRIQIDLDPEDWTQLEEFMTKYGIQTKRDLFLNALSFYEWGVGEVAAGKSIASVNQEEKVLSHILIPGLRHSRITHAHGK